MQELRLQEREQVGIHLRPGCLEHPMGHARVVDILCTFDYERRLLS